MLPLLKLHYMLLEICDQTCMVLSSSHCDSIMFIVSFTPQKHLFLITEAPTQSGDGEEDAPPKVEFKQVEEKDALYSKR